MVNIHPRRNEGTDTVQLTNLLSPDAVLTFRFDRGNTALTPSVSSSNTPFCMVTL